MARSVLCAFIIAVILVVCGAFVSAEAYFDDGLLARAFWRSRPDMFSLGERIPARAPDSAPFGFIPPIDATSPQVTYADSIDATGIKRIVRIRGIEERVHSVIPYDTYLARNLAAVRDSLWTDNRKRMQDWKSEDAGRAKGITDLDFVLPGSKTLSRFMGGGETSLRIDGSQRITFEGRSEWTEGQIETSANKNSSFPALTMKQEPKFQITGTVADRITVDIRQDPSSGTFGNLDENIKIKYQGEDQDIIRFIEAGNTSLSLDGATFAGYRGSHKGLFGIRTEGQLGPLKFTAIASQEKSKSSKKSFRGSAEETSTQIKDYNYKANTYFFLDYIYREQFASARTSFDLIRYDPADSLVTFEVYVDDGNRNNNLSEATFALHGLALPMDMGGGTTNPDMAVEGSYHRLDPSRDYYVDRSLGYVQFARRIPDEWSVGVYMVTRGDEARGIPSRTYGSLDYDTNDLDSMITLKLVKRKQQRPTDNDTWNLEWKNVYDLGQQMIEPDGLKISIFRVATDGNPRPSQDGVPYIRLLGLDNTDELGGSSPDNKVDLNRGFVNLVRGEIIFPILRPFDPTAPPAGVTTELKAEDRIPAIYDSQDSQLKEEKSKFYIEVQTANRQAVIDVGGFGGIMEGTEQVLLDGKPLSRGTDYRIDYMMGRITLLKEEALSPTANIEIQFEEPEAMQQMQKTLLGLRTEYALSSNSRLGGVVLFKNESTTDKRVRLGQEPSRMLLFDADARLNFESRRATAVLDRMPLLVASQPTTMRIEGEIAQSLPNMNTKGIVYIDDFEGSSNTPIGVIRSNWTQASRPDRSASGGAELTRGRLQWYNPWDRIKSKDIWPNKETVAGENTVHVLTMAYGKPEGVHKDQAYGGVMTSLWGGGIDMSRSRFVEIWARGARGALNVDLGAISEDYYNKEAPASSAGNGILDTEDAPIPGQAQGDGVLTKEEDRGLDAMTDAQEKAFYLALADKTNDSALKGYYRDRAALPDPSGDNFGYSTSNKNDYGRLNGTEGNASDGDRMGIPDTEDINRNGILDTRNAYYEYSMSFEDPFDPYLVQDSVPSGNPYGWRLFRIPLWNNPAATVGGTAPPDSTLIEYVRMWVTGADTTLIQIASIEIVESKWLEQGIMGPDGEDLTGAIADRVRVTTANTHENFEYTPPPGVKAEIDPDTKIRRKEQSLMLKVENLDAGNTAFVYRTMDKMDFTDYTSLNMFAHGPDDFPDPSTGEPGAELILRFGGDDKNYYEYRAPIYKGWDDQNEVQVDFARMTGLKLGGEYETYLAMPDSIAAPADSLGGKIYTLHGRPSMDNIRRLVIGVRNVKTNERLNADIWVDELRMDSLRDMTGSAARVNITTDLAGFINLKAEAKRTTADFHDMNSKKGTGRDATDWSTSMDVNLNRLAPNRWNISLPASVSMAGSEALPRLMSGSDIILKDSQKDEYKSTSDSKSYRIRYTKSKDPTLDGVTGLLVNWTFDKFSAGYDWGERSSATPSSGNSQDYTRQVTAGYDVNPTVKTVKALSWLPQLPFEMWEKFAFLDVAYTPKQLSYDYALNQSDSYRANIDGVADTTQTKTTTEQFNFGYAPLKALDYTFKRTSDKDLYLKHEVEFTEQNRITLKGPTILYLDNNYTYTANYTEQDNPRYSLSSQLGSKNIKMSTSFSANGSLAWEQLFEVISGAPRPPRQKFARPEKKREQNVDDLPPVSAAPQPRATAPADTTKKGPGITTVVLSAVSKALSPIRLDYKKSDQQNLAGIADRPDFKTRFGQGTIEEPDSLTVVSRQNSTVSQTTYSANTKMSLPLDIGISASGKYSTDESLSASSTALTKDFTFPELSLSWSNLDRKVPHLDKLASNVNLNSSFSVNNARNWQNESTRPVTDKTLVKFSPLISINMRVLKNVTTSFSVNSSSESTDGYSGSTQSTTVRDQGGTNTTIQYTISSMQGIPLLKKLSLKSNIDLRLTFTTTASETKKRIGDEAMATIASDDAWALSPGADYQFSQKFRGGMKMEFRNSTDMTKRVRKVREVSIWGELQF